MRGTVKGFVTARDAYILLVEDNEDDVFLTQRALVKQGVANEVVVVRDGAAALDFLFARGEYEDRRPTNLPQLVLLDINLPKLSGLEVLRQLRAAESTRLLPVVVFTTSQEERDLIESYESRANAYVRKPVDAREFGEAIHRVGAYWLLLNEPPPG